MPTAIFRLFAVICLATSALGFSFNLGRCPSVQNTDNFNLDKLSGLWYVVQKLSGYSACWTYEFVKINGTVQLIEKRNQMVDHDDPEELSYTTGLFEYETSNKTGNLYIHYPLRITGRASFHVVDTDLEHYAGIYTCQQILLGYTSSAVILSRKPYLERRYSSAVRERLAGYGIDLKDMNTISHIGCKYYPPLIPDTIEDFNSLETFY